MPTNSTKRVSISESEQLPRLINPHLLYLEVRSLTIFLRKGVSLQYPSAKIVCLTTSYRIGMSTVNRTTYESFDQSESPFVVVDFKSRLRQTDWPLQKRKPRCEKKKAIE